MGWRRALGGTSSRRVWLERISDDDDALALPSRLGRARFTFLRLTSAPPLCVPHVEPPSSESFARGFAVECPRLCGAPCQRARRGFASSARSIALRQLQRAPRPDPLAGTHGTPSSGCEEARERICQGVRHRHVEPDTALRARIDHSAAQRRRCSIRPTPPADPPNAR